MARALRSMTMALALALSGCGGDGSGATSDLLPLDASVDEDCGCRSDSECPAPAPYCVGTCGSCGTCRTDDDCPLGALCYAAGPGHYCLANTCTAKHGCAPGDRPLCDLEVGLCVSCLADNDCHSPEAPVCWTHVGCAPCLPDRDVCPHGTYCENVGREGARYECRPGCKDKRDCPASDGGPPQDCLEHQCVPG